MTPIEIGFTSVGAIVFLIYAGVYIPVALGMVSLISIWLMRDNFTLSLNLLKIAVGVVAGSSVLGMIIPPSAMLIIYSFVAEQSVGDMFLAGVISGIMLAIAYVSAIWIMGRFTPDFVGGRVVQDKEWMSKREIASKTLPTIGLIVIVLGGIYTGWMTAVEAGATGSLVALIILIVVPLFLPLVEALDMSLIWFGIITVVGAEIGLLTPPLGISCFVIKSTLNDDRISLKDVFMGALPFAFVMLIVLFILIELPILSLVLL